MNSRKVALYSIVIGAYVAISIALGAFSFGMIQVRIAEVFVLLCLIKLEYTIPLTVACLVTNIIGISMGINFPLDFIFGTLATLLSCLTAYYFRNKLWLNLPILSLLMPCIFNGIIIGLEIAYYGEVFNFATFALNGAFVFLGEFISCVILGCLLYKPFLSIYHKFMQED